MTQSTLFHSDIAVGTALLSTREVDCKILLEKVANICNNVFNIYNQEIYKVLIIFSHVTLLEPISYHFSPSKPFILIHYFLLSCTFLKC